MKRCDIFCAGDFDGYTVPGKSFVIAADGGVNYTAQLGIEPDLVLGDFDSLGYVPQGARVFPVEKDDTDAMLAVKEGLARGYDQFMLYGCLGGKRLDHTIAALQTLQYLADRGAEGYLIGSREILTVVKNGALHFSSEAKGIFSLFCLGPNARGVDIQGAKYGASNVMLTSGFPLGVSNHFVGKAVTVSVADGSLLALWDRENGFPERRKR